MIEEARSSFWKQHCDVTDRDRHNQRRIIAWSAVWMLSWLGVNLAIRFGWLTSGALATVAVLPTTALGVGMILAYRRFLRDADELRRKIELDALALAFGVGIVGGFSYWLLGRAGAVAEVDLLDIILLMVATHVLGVLVGTRRYA